MHSQSFVAVAAAVLCAATVSNAVPLIARDNTTTTTTTYSSTPAAAAATSTPATGPTGGPIAVIFPDTTSQFHVNTGAVDFNLGRGLVSRSPSNGGADITTLVTFALDASYAGHRCQVVFDLTDPSSYTYGTQKAQVFTSIAPATMSTTTWPSGNLRNQALGTIDVALGSRAVFEAGSGPGATTNGFFDCSDIAGKLFGGELVPQGDSDVISWAAWSDGPKILVF